MRTLIPALLLLCTGLPAQAPVSSLPISVNLRPAEDPYHLLDPSTPFAEDLALLLKENAFSAAQAETPSVPRLTLVPSAYAIQGGYVYGVVAFLQRPGADTELRSSIAGATREKRDVVSGLRQAVIDVAAVMLQKSNGTPHGEPFRKVNVLDAPKAGSNYPLIPIEKLHARLQPDPPRLPPFARARGIRGVVEVSLIVGSDGKPNRAYILSGPPELALLSLAYSFQYAFEPPRAGSGATPFRTELPLAYGVGFGAAHLDSLGHGFIGTIPDPSDP